MQVIARKSKSIKVFLTMGVVYASLGLILASVITIGLGSLLNWENPVYLTGLLFLLFTVVGIIIIIMFISKNKLPLNLICRNADNLIIIDQVVSISDIKDVTYKNYSSKSGTYSFGDIKFTLYNGIVIKVPYVADLEETSKILSKIVYSKQSY